MGVERQGVMIIKEVAILYTNPPTMPPSPALAILSTSYRTSVRITYLAPSSAEGNTGEPSWRREPSVAPCW